MIFYGKEKNNYDYAKSIFFGTCEISNYESVYLNYKDYDEMLKKVPFDKYYYYTEISDNPIFGLVNKNFSNDYELADMIKTVIKILDNIGIEDFQVKSDKFSELLKNNLESIDIAAQDEILKNDEYLKVYVSGDEVIVGRLIDNILNFEISYNSLSRHINHENSLKYYDVYVSTTDDSLLGDALIIGNNLKDAGVVTEINLTLKRLDEDSLKADFLVLFNKEDISNYQVTLRDLKTKEERKVGIDDLVEEISFM